MRVTEVRVLYMKYNLAQLYGVVVVTCGNHDLTRRAAACVWSRSALLEIAAPCCHARLTHAQCGIKILKASEVEKKRQQNNLTIIAR